MTRTFVEPPDGIRYYDLSHHIPGEAEQLFAALIEFSAIPVRMPFGCNQTQPDGFDCSHENHTDRGTMTDLENLQKQEHLYAVAEEEQFDQTCQQIWDLFIQLSPAHQHDLLEKLRDDFAIDLSEDDDA